MSDTVAEQSPSTSATPEEQEPTPEVLSGLDAILERFLQIALEEGPKLTWAARIVKVDSPYSVSRSASRTSSASSPSPEGRRTSLS